MITSIDQSPVSQAASATRAGSASGTSGTSGSPGMPWLGRGVRAALAGLSLWLAFTWLCVKAPAWLDLAGLDGRAWPGGLDDALDGVIGLSSILLLTWWTRCLDFRTGQDPQEL